MKIHWHKLGQIGRPLGLGGHFSLSTSTEIDSRPSFEASLGGEPSCGVPVFVESSRNSKRPSFKIDGINDRDSILSLQGQALWIKAKAPSETRYLGAWVCDCDGHRLGTVTGICNYGASDLLVIEGDDQRHLEVPFVENYLDQAMEKKGDVSVLTLKVSRRNFADFWF